MTAQIIAVIIFALMFVMIIIDKIPRHIVTLGCGLATIGIVFAACMKSTDAIEQTLNIKSIFTPDFWIVSGQAEADAFPQTPRKVIINEYVEIAKFYSTPDSRAFVNGLLDKLINNKD